MSVYSTPINIDGDCVFDFPAPNRVFNGRTLNGHHIMTIEYCKDFCSGMEIFFLIQIGLNRVGSGDLRRDFSFIRK